MIFNLTNEDLYLIRSALSEAQSYWYARKREAEQNPELEYDTNSYSNIINDYTELLDRLDELERLT